MKERSTLWHTLHVDIHITWRFASRKKISNHVARFNDRVASIEKSTLISSDAHHHWVFFFHSMQKEKFLIDEEALSNRFVFTFTSQSEIL